MLISPSQSDSEESSTTKVTDLVPREYISKSLYHAKLIEDLISATKHLISLWNIVLHLKGKKIIVSHTTHFVNGILQGVSFTIYFVGEPTVDVLHKPKDTLMENVKPTTLHLIPQIIR